MNKPSKDKVNDETDLHLPEQSGDGESATSIIQDTVKPPASLSAPSPPAVQTVNEGSLKPRFFTRDEANRILSERYPEPEELDRFPLGELLKAIPSVDDRYGRQRDGKPGHIDRVVEGVNILLSDRPQNIVQSWRDGASFDDTYRFNNAYQTIFSRKETRVPYCDLAEQELGIFFRLLAMYHDIGKFVINDRHPVVGWHLLNDVFLTEYRNELYPFILGRDIDEWKAMYESSGRRHESITSTHEQRLLQLFDDVIQYHDYFGVLSTGEGSYPIMVDLINLRGTDPKRAQELFSVLMMFGLADVFGSVAEVLPEKVKAHCDDWELMCNAISEVRGDREQFFQKLLERAQNPDYTITRLWRLMYEGCPPEWRDNVSPDMVERTFKQAVLAGVNSFIKNFAVICKLDYCLGFKLLLMRKAFADNMAPNAPVTVMLNLLAELERRYGALCKRSDGTWRRIGIEMAGLTRKSKASALSTEQDVGATICKLLLGRDGLGNGKEWAVGECTTWLIEE